MMPKIRLHVAERAFPVPRCGVGNSSGVKPYSTAYMRLLQKLNAQFHPSKASLVNAVVDPYRNTPVSTVLTDSAPFLPTLGSSMRNPPSNDPGTPITAMMRLFRYVMYVLPSPKSAPRVAWM